MRLPRLYRNAALVLPHLNAIFTLVAPGYL